MYTYSILLNGSFFCLWELGKYIFSMKKILFVILCSKITLFKIEVYNLNKKLIITQKWFCLKPGFETWWYQKSTSLRGNKKCRMSIFLLFFANKRNINRCNYSLKICIKNIFINLSYFKTEHKSTVFVYKNL